MFQINDNCTEEQSSIARQMFSVYHSIERYTIKTKSKIGQKQRRTRVQLRDAHDTTKEKEGTTR